MNLKNPSYQPKRLDLGDATLLIADQGNLTFTGMDWPSDPTIWTDGSTVEAYIPDGAHVLPADAALPILARTPRWDCPPPERFNQVRLLLEQITNIGCIVEPGWERIRHLVGLHLGGPLPKATSFERTNVEWHRDYWDISTRTKRKRGWYYGTLSGWSANGIDNNHYNRILWEAVALIYEGDHEKRKAAWPHFVQQAINHACLGREWSGPFKGFAKGEKGDAYIGVAANGASTRSYAKDWTPNLVLAWLLTGQEVFRAALNNAADFYAGSTYAWGGAWGARIPGRMLDNMLNLWLVLPEYRFAMQREMGEVLDILSFYLDRVEWFWLNKGNNGKGPMSGWMHAEAVAAILRVHEHIPALRGRGPSTQECANVMARVMATDMGVEGGSELINGYACLRYRFHTDTGESMNARFLVSTAFALPALRLLAGQGFLEREYDNCRDLVQRYAGSNLSPATQDLQNGTPYPLSQIGYRFPREGWGWCKTVLEWVEAVR